MYGATTELPPAVIDAIAQVASGELSRVAQLVPAAPAAVLGRLAHPEPDRSGRLGRPGQYRGLMGATADTARALASQRNSAPQHSSAARAALAEMPALVSERLLGALEVTVAALELPVPELVAALPEAPARTGPHRVMIATMGGDSETCEELSKLDAFVPGASDMVGHLVGVLAAHPLIAPLLEAPGASTDEAAIAAAHGARHLALAVVTATIVVRPLWPFPEVAPSPAAIVGAALGVVVPVLREAAMPAGYAEAALAKQRADYLMPRHGSVRAVVTDHVFTLTESPLASAPDFSGNGLLAVVTDGIALRSAQESGVVSVSLAVLREAPALDTETWDEVVEASWHAPAGGASFSGDGQTSQVTPPWPGDYRVRVSVRGRDEAAEHYQIAVWSAPAAETVVHKQTDRLGYRLRGEPEPPEPVLPDEVYHWVESSSLSEAATVTFVAGKTSPEVLRAFGADEAAPTPIAEFYDRDYHDIDPWVCVLDVPGGTVAVEFNGWQGSTEPALRALSSPHHLAASMFWNINAVKRFSLARAGEVLTNFELGIDETTHPEAVELLADLDGEGRHPNAVGLLAATRFTGLSLSAADLARIESVGIGYPILPLLPDLYPVPRHSDGTRVWLGDGPLGADTGLLAAMPDAELHDLAWWVASFAAAHSDISGHRAVRASLAARALTPEAETLARRSELHEHMNHRWLWRTLHAATNPDALGAVVQALSAARYAVAGHAAELLESARARVTTGAV